jgi:hypothetical protein
MIEDIRELHHKLRKMRNKIPRRMSFEYNDGVRAGEAQTLDSVIKELNRIILAEQERSGK